VDTPSRSPRKVGTARSAVLFNRASHLLYHIGRIFLREHSKEEDGVSQDTVEEAQSRAEGPEEARA